MADSGYYTFLYKLNNVNYFSPGQVAQDGINQVVSTMGSKMTITNVPLSQYNTDLITSGTARTGIDLGSFMLPATDIIKSNNFQGGVTAYYLVPDPDSDSSTTSGAMATQTLDHH